MKKLFLICCLNAFMLVHLTAQVKTPAASPASTLKQSVGLVDVTIEYSRPSVKDRVIFGDLVPYDKMWRTGANKNTMITFSDAINFGGVDVEAGTYALFTKPSSGAWDVYLYTDTENWGTPEDWSEDKVAAAFKSTPTMGSHATETLTFDIGHLRDNSANLTMNWDKLTMSIPLSVNTDEMVQTTIDKTMAGPSAGDLYSAARYYREKGKDLDEALTWMTKSIEGRGETFWNLRQLSLIQADMGKYADAIATAKKSLELSKAANYDSYIKSNEASIAEWAKMKK